MEWFSSWTELTEFNTARANIAGSGSSTDALIFGGRTPSPAANVTSTEAWDGSAWTEVNDVGTATYENMPLDRKYI